LICRNCRLVNGQAPPGTKNLAEVGKWKCFGCGELNGEEDEGTKAVQEMKELIETDTKDEEKNSPAASVSSPEELVAAEELIVDDEEVEDESEGDTIEVSKPKKGRLKGSKKKT